MSAHTYARDRAPIASASLPTLWRYRWNCSCGQTGVWHTEAPERVWIGWLGHRNVRRRRDLREAS